MGRIRTVKPEIAKHEVLFDAEQETGLPLRFAWVMLFTVCDREGRFAWRPRRLKPDILPYDEVDISRVLDAWLTRGLLVKYRVGDAWIGWVPTFRKHQVINHRETDSDLPSIDEADEVEDHRNQSVAHALSTRHPPDDDASGTREGHAHGGREGKGREGDRDASGTRQTFTPPSVTQVQAYLQERNSNVDPERFIDFYASKGWMVGKNRMKDWKAAVRTWERNGKSGPDETAEPNYPVDPYGQPYR